MTPKQEEFANEYIKTGDKAKSYLKVYKTCKKIESAAANATRLLSNAKIKRYIADRMEKKDKKRIASQDEVLEYYTRLMRGEEKESQVVVTPTGDVIENDVKPTLKERTKGADALAKRYGMDKMVEREVEESVKIVIVPRK